jgi:gas vesicle protein
LGEKKYVDYLDSLPKAELDSFSRDLVKNPILGSAEFINRVQAEVNLQQQTIDSALSLSGEGKNNRKLILAGRIAIVILGAASALLFIASRGMKAKLKEELAKKDIEITTKLNQNKEFIKKDLDEKYRADLVSYQAMTKRLEIEKDKVKKLEEEANSQKRK